MAKKIKKVKKDYFQFVPHDYSVFRYRLQGGSSFSSWRRRGPSIFASAPLNQRTLGDIFGVLHYKACHAPEAVQKVWRDAYDRFMERHRPSNASMRFANEFTADRWL